MTSSTKSVFTTAAIIVALLVITTRTAEGQQADCASKLIACASYLNSTNPAPECCNAIREVVSTQLPCLCNLYNNPGMLAGINITQALELPKHCNLSADTSKCKEALSPTSSAVPPPGVPGGNDGSGVGKSISSVGIPSLFLLSAIVMFH